MRRMVKEELVKFDGTPLFPERKAYTANYVLSRAESALYEAVTHYVKTEMGKADQLDGQRRGSVGFALTTLQRRLASSPEAIYQSLRRRKERLTSRLHEDKLGERSKRLLAETLDDVPEDDDDLNADEQETLEESLVDQATAAKTTAELKVEITILQSLEQQAKLVVASGQDRKWEELSKLLQNNPEMRDAAGNQRKLIIFTEHRDTLNYLQAKIAGVLGDPDAIVAIHGGTHRDERKKAQALFRSDPAVKILVATDAAGEGVSVRLGRDGGGRSARLGGEGLQTVGCDCHDAPAESLPDRSRCLESLQDVFEASHRPLLHVPFQLRLIALMPGDV